MFILAFSSIRVDCVFRILMIYFTHFSISEIGMHFTVDSVTSTRFFFLCGYKLRCASQSMVAYIQKKYIWSMF